VCAGPRQYERSTDAYERLTSATDARGRKIEVLKVPCPPPLFRTYKEASGVHVRGPHPYSSIVELSCHVRFKTSIAYWSGLGTRRPLACTRAARAARCAPALP